MSVLDLFRLEGKVAIITGGSRGLGRAMAVALLEAGASLTMTARSLDTAEAAAAEVGKGTCGRTLGLAVDVTRPAEVEAMVARTLAAADWDAVIDANLKGPWLCCRAVAPHLKAQRSGRVINVSSMLGEISLPERTPYASSKGGLTLLTKTLALEWAPFGITVNALCPGPFLTEINVPLLSDPAVRAAMEAKIPLGRWGDPAELGPAAVFLASDASSFMTGATLFLDGGYTAQ